MEFNPVIKAVQSLRKIALDVRDSNNEVRKNGLKIVEKIDECEKMIVSLNETNITGLWIAEQNNFMEATENFTMLLKRLDEKFTKKDISNLSEFWDSSEKIKSKFFRSLEEMKDLGDTLFKGNQLGEWNNHWDERALILNKNSSVLETYKLKLAAIEALKPEEIDELTQEVLKHIPLRYSIEEAYKYEKEYIQAYNELKEMRDKKKNLWDKILDIIAGGIQETPAHRVQMRRWLDDEK